MTLGTNTRRWTDKQIELRSITYDEVGDGTPVVLHSAGGDINGTIQMYLDGVYGIEVDGEICYLATGDQLDLRGETYLWCEPTLEERWKGGYPQELVDWYNAGADGAINWGEDGDFEACVAIASKYIDNAEGFCNLRHQDATGAPPGKADGEQEDKSQLGAHVRRWEAAADTAKVQAAADADNLYSVGHSHHASNGRHFDTEHPAPEDRATPVSVMNAIELRILHNRSK